MTVGPVTLVAKYTDYMGYTTFVFKRLEQPGLYDSYYIMCVMFPNWNQEEIKIDDIGILDVEEVIAGVTTWYDGDKQIPYKYNMVIFKKFIPLPKKKEFNYIIR